MGRAVANGPILAEDEMIAGRLLGRLFMALALLALGAEAVRSLEAAAWMPFAIGEVWFWLHKSSLGLAQAGIQRYVHAAIWDPVAITMLRWPAWGYGVFLGTGLLYFCRLRSERRVFTRRS